MLCVYVHSIFTVHETFTSIYSLALLAFRIVFHLPLLFLPPSFVQKTRTRATPKLFLPFKWTFSPPAPQKPWQAIRFRISKMRRVIIEEWWWAEPRSRAVFTFLCMTALVNCAEGNAIYRLRERNRKTKLIGITIPALSAPWVPRKELNDTTTDSFCPRNFPH